MTAAFRRHHELLGMLVARNLKIRYKNSALGFLWSLLTPGLFILMYAVFARILKFSGSREGYLPFLVTGIIVWQFTASCLNDSLNAIAGNANLVKKVAFPRVILPLSTALANAVNSLLTLLVLFVFLLATGSARLALCAWLLPALAVQLALAIGVSCLAATANVFFRDTQHIVGIGAQAWFFLTPVFYPIEMQTGFLPPEWADALFLNPMTGILAAYRTAILGDPLPSLAQLGISTLVTTIVLALGLQALRRGDRQFGDVL
jgi:ABC-2 type transport system permease protein